MRQIKFRAWYNNKMLDVFAYNPINKTVYLSHQQLLGLPGDDVLVNTINEVNEYGAAVMQFTGLTDKNGREIYEGDIVSTPSYGEIGTVEWNKGKANFFINYTKSKQLGKYDFQLGNNTDLEVIGNIYENKELINE